MPLPAAREGDPLGFHAYPRFEDMGTLGDAEQITWSSIRHICSRSVAEQLAELHGVSSDNRRRGVARNVKLYIQQASEFYDAAQTAKPNTAPLIYYYAFLNLAKALCEFKSPHFHQNAECYRHGLSWRPDTRITVAIYRETVTLTTRGVWHALWEALMGVRCPAGNPTRLRVIDLFTYCPEIATESASAFGEHLRLLDLEKPNIMMNNKTREVWLNFSLFRQDLRLNQISAPAILNAIASSRSRYREVASADKMYRTFESIDTVRVRIRRDPYDSLIDDFRALNLFSYMGEDRELGYAIPVQHRLPLRLPQAIVSYTLLFWLGSLVRYDPHSVSALMDSPAWLAIDGFMSQSRLWLLEQIQWALYQSETTLWYSR